ncbi:MAG: hypothetical protein ABUS79_03610 [Pseudomonadota bacterium]
MLRSPIRPRVMGAALLAAACGSTFVRTAPAAAESCANLPNPVFVVGSTAAKPIIAEVGKILVAQTPVTTIVYSGQGSCAGVDAILNGTPMQGTGTSGPSTWNLAGNEVRCDIPPTGPPVVADVGMSDVYATTCFPLPGGMPSNVGDFLGPVQTMTFVAPKSSPERSISAEAAYYVYGFGANSGVNPWTDEAWIFRRDDQSGTQRMIAAAIGVSPARWKGAVTASSSDMLTKVTVVGTGAQTIGILSADIAQENRAVLNILAYRHFGQSCAYFPDKDASSNEKINVRDGHYAIWGPLHLLTRLSAIGYPASAAAGNVIGYMTGTKTPPPGLDPIALEAQLHMIPRCAMRVTRIQELGPLASFAPAGACGCYYDKLANGVSTCRTCVSSNDCLSTAPICNYGYCETQ